MTLEDAARAGRRRRPDTARGNRWVSAVITAGLGSGAGGTVGYGQFRLFLPDYVEVVYYY